MTISIERVLDLTGQLRNHLDADVAELAEAAYEMANQLQGVAGQLAMFNFGSDDGGE